MQVPSKQLGGLACVLALAVVSCGFASTDASRSDVIAYLRDFSSAGEQLATVIDATVYPARAVRATDDWPRDGWDEAAATTSTYRWVYGSRRLRMEQLEPEGVWPSCCGSERASRIWLWTGSVSYTFLYDAHHEHREIQIKLEHKSGPSLESFPVWNGGVEASSLVGFDSLVTIARDYTLLETGGDDDSLWLTFDLGISRTMELTMQFNEHPSLELRELDVRVFSRSADGGRSLTMRKTVTVDAWRDFDGRRLPAQVTVIACNLRNSQAFRTTYVRRTVEMFQAERAFGPSTAIMEGDVVRDATLRIAYRIGDDEMNVDGELFRLKQPVDAVVVDELPAILEGAEPEDET